MKIEKALSNESFDFLKGSSEFLNIVLNNINSCVLLLNRHMELHAFNNALKTIFTNKKDEDLLYRRCGEAIGCAYQIEEHTDCGNTSHCHGCELRAAALESYVSNEPVYRDRIEKPFYNSNNEKENKCLQFSTRIFKFEKDKYVVLMVEDITKVIALEKCVS